MAPLMKVPSTLITATIILQLLVLTKSQNVESIVGSACNKTAECAATCGKIIYCENEKVPNEGVDCPASHPHCMTDARADRCSNMPNPKRPQCLTNQVKPKDFFCTELGYFPGSSNFQ